MKIFYGVLGSLVLWGQGTLSAAESQKKEWVASGDAFVEVKRFPAKEARQGVAVDAEHFYAIDNKSVGKYRKADGQLVLEWKYEGPDDLVHFNAGMVHEGKLYLAHSNFPKFPPSSSIEIFDTQTLKAVGTRSFGISDGSLTWVDFREDKWYACFVSYDVEAFRAIGKGPKWSQIIEFDKQGNREQAWVFPDELIERFHGYSASGGAIGNDGRFYVTGHDAREVYVLEIPQMGSRLRWVDTLPIATAGQAGDWDESLWAKGVNQFYSIERKTKEVVISELKPGEK